MLAWYTATLTREVGPSGFAVYHPCAALDLYGRLDHVLCRASLLLGRLGRTSCALPVHKPPFIRAFLQISFHVISGSGSTLAGGPAYKPPDTNRTILVCAAGCCACAQPDSAAWRGRCSRVAGDANACVAPLRALPASLAVTTSSSHCRLTLCACRRPADASRPPTNPTGCVHRSAKPARPRFARLLQAICLWA